MERKCSQSIRIEFPQRVFFGSEITVDIPKSGGDMVKDIRLVIEFPDSANILGERILQRAELLAGGEMIDTIYGEFIHVENNFTVSSEKRTKLSELLCTTGPGTFYMKIPFGSDEIFLFEKTDLQVRLLFADGQGEEIFGHLLVDYFVIESKPNTPYVQKTTQIQKFSRTVQNPSRLKMSVYAVGPVYQLYFTVKDTTTGEYIDAIKNIKLFFNEVERFNLENRYLRYTEPLKCNGTFLQEPMYMYSFCLDPQKFAPNGSTHFPTNSYFEIDFYDNQSEYEVTIWAKSHDFLYVKDTIKRMFESTELLLDSTVTEVSDFKKAPLKISYINYSGSIVFFYYSDYEISNVSVTTDAQIFTQTQNTIELNYIDSVNSDYTANVVFSIKGFEDVTCYFRILGNNVYLDNVIYNSQGQYPTHIDLGQSFHYVYSNVFDFSNYIFTTSNIGSLNINENGHFVFTTYSPNSCVVLGDSNVYSGPVGIIAEYDTNMNLVFSKAFQGSNVRAMQSNVYGTDGGVVNAFGSQINVTAGSSSVLIDDISLTNASLRVTNSSSGISINQETPYTFGINSERLILLSFTSGVSPVIVSNVQSTKSSLDSSTWVFGYKTNSYISDSNVPSLVGSQGYLVYNNTWNVRITNIPSFSNIRPKILRNEILGITYVVCGYDSTTPQLSGFTFQNGSGIFVLKIDSSGTVKYALSFIGSIRDAYPMVDKATGKFMMTVESINTPLLYMYNNGVQKYSDYGKYQFFIFDDYGNINSTAQNLNDLFSVSKPLYYKPFPNAEYFNKYRTQNPGYTYWTSPLIGTSTDTRLVSIEPDQTNDDLYVLCEIISGFSNVFDKYGDTKTSIAPKTDTGINFVLYKLYSNCVFSNILVHITGLKDGLDGQAGSVKIRNGYIYILCSTFGSSNIYERNSSVSSVGITTTSPSLLLLKFDMNGTYQNWYLTIDNSFGSSLKVDSDNNLYFTGVKTSTGSQTISINGNARGTLQSTTYPNSSFVSKLDSNDDFSWVCYVDDSTSNKRIGCAISSNGSVYLASSKTGNYTSSINGSVNTIPTALSSSYSYAYVVKFNNLGTYANWYSNFETGSTSTSDVNINTNDELHMYIGYNYDKKLYINGTEITTLLKVSTADPADSACILKYNSNGTYSSNVRIGSESGNYNAPYRLAIDSSNSYYTTFKKQGTRTLIKDAQNNSGYVPVTSADAAAIIKINANGSFSNLFGYCDTLDIDEMQLCKISNNGDVYTSSIVSTRSLGSYDSTVYDRDGFAYIFNSPSSYTKIYNIILKYNSNMTLNKISL